MASTFALAPIPIWYFADSNGKAAGGCIMYPRSSKNASLWKPVFTEPTGTIPWEFNSEGGIVFEENGSQGPFYWEDNGIDKYQITIKNEAGDILWEIDQFPVDGGGGSTPIDIVSNIQNLIIDGQFRFLDFDNPLSPIPDGETLLEKLYGGTHNVDGWYFNKNVVGNTDSLSFYRTSLSSTSPDENPLHILAYECTSAGAGGTRLDLGYRTYDVKTFSGKDISIRFSNKATGAPLDVEGEVYYRQVFGTGGAPSAPNDQVFPFTFSAGVFDDFEQTINVDLVGGNSLGTNDDDYFEIGIRFPIGSTGLYEVTNFEMVRGIALPDDYLYETYNDTAYKVGLANLQAQIDIINNSIFQVGDMVFSPINSIRPGFIVIDATNSIGNTGSGASFTGDTYLNLYTIWWNQIPQAVASVVGGRGVSAVADWAANKRMHLLSIPGMVFGNLAGYAAVGFTEGTRNETLTINQIPSHDHGISTVSGAQVQLGVLRGNGSTPLVLQETELTGGGQPHNNVQPTVYFYVYVKY